MNTAVGETALDVFPAAFLQVMAPILLDKTGRVDLRRRCSLMS